MKRKITITNLLSKFLLLTLFSAFICNTKSSAQIVIENKMPEKSQFQSITTKIGGVLTLNGFFDIKGGLNKLSSFNLASVDVYDSKSFNAFNMHMRLSILRMINEFKLKNGETITTKVEGDFNGAQTFETMPAFKLRHINVKYKGWLVGQDWSTFSDTGALINTLDADGPSIGLGFRKPVVRYTFNYKEPLKVDVALEQPLIDYSLKKVNNTTNSGEVKQVTPYFPELIGAVEYSFGTYASHVRLAGVFRKISYLEKNDYTKHATSWGTSLSTRLNMNDNLSFVLQGNVGKGIGIYTSTFAGNKYDGFETDGKLKTIPAFGGFAAMEVRYGKSSRLSSTFAIGYSQFQLDAKNNQEISLNGYYGPNYNAKYGSDYNKLHIEIPYASANLMYKAFENFTVGAELNWGGKTLITKSDKPDLSDKKDSRQALRLTFGMLYQL